MSQPALAECRHLRRIGLPTRRAAVLLDGGRYCLEHCLEGVLSDALRQARSTPSDIGVAHRVPLGLLLLARQQLTVEQLRSALLAQRAAGHGKIGEWLQTLGYVSETQVTAALARQWSCPVLRASAVTRGSRRGPQVPFGLLEFFVMTPVDYVETTTTLHVACGDGVDYRVLYAIERMLGCHTEPCMASPSFVRSRLDATCAHRLENDLLFERVSDTAESSRIIRSYCARLSATEIRVSACGPYLWIRLLRPSHPPMNLLFRSSQPLKSAQPVADMSSGRGFA